LQWQHGFNEICFDTKTNAGQRELQRIENNGKSKKKIRRGERINMGRRRSRENNQLLFKINPLLFTSPMSIIG